MKINQKLFLVIVVSLFFIESADAKNRQINSWQKAVVDIGKSITEADQSGSSWIVEYNSSFPSVNVGIVLSPSSYDKKASSLNVIAICSPKNAEIISTDGRDFASFSTNKSIDFNGEANPPPLFITGSLDSPKAALSISSQKQIVFDFSDVQIQQISESDAIDAVNNHECIRRIRHRSEIFFVRGQYLMRLSIAQSSAVNSSVGASLGNSASDPIFGFKVRWDNANNWILHQILQRPWFRIVSKFKKNKSGTRFEIVQ